MLLTDKIRTDVTNDNKKFTKRSSNWESFIQNNIKLWCKQI